MCLRRYVILLMTIFGLSLFSSCYASSDTDTSTVVIPRQELIILYQDMSRLNQLNEKILEESKISKNQLQALREQLENSQILISNLQARLKESQTQLEELKIVEQKQEYLLRKANQELKDYSAEMERKDDIHRFQRDLYCGASIFLLALLMSN